MSSLHALAIRAADLALPPGFNGFFDSKSYALFVDEYGTHQTVPNIFQMPSYLLDRAVCETDLSYLQFIGYGVLRAVTPEGNYVATYQRGKGGNEPGLHDLWSIGFGGHVDTAPEEGTHLLQHLAEHTCRELTEEVDIKVTVGQIIASLAKCQFLYAPETDVDKVHLAMCFMLDYTAAFELKTTEVNQIKNLTWYPVDVLRQMAAEGKLETWSRKLIESNIVS